MMGLVECFVSFGLKNLRYPWSRLRQRLFEGRYLKTELPAAESLKEVQDRLKKITWTPDGFFHLYDALSYPQTVWAKKKDDCDGFAVLAAELIQRWEPSLNPVLVTAAVRPLRKSHTVCAFKDGEKLAFFDNTRLRRGDYKSYADIVKKFTSERSAKVVCWDVVKPDTLEALEFHRV
jgi:hypothetical protein